MQRLQTYKFQIESNGEQLRDLRRSVYNKSLVLQKENHEAGNKFIGYVAMAKNLTERRNGTETPWLEDSPCQPLQHALKGLNKAYKNFFAQRTDFPRAKKKGRTIVFAPRCKAIQDRRGDTAV